MRLWRKLYWKKITPPFKLKNGERRQAMEELYFDYEENFAEMLDDMDMDFDDEFWDAYDPE